MPLSNFAELRGAIFPRPERLGLTRTPIRQRAPPLPLANVALSNAGVEASIRLPQSVCAGRGCEEARWCSQVEDDGRRAQFSVALRDERAHLSVQ